MMFVPINFHKVRIIQTSQLSNLNIFGNLNTIQSSFLLEVIYSLKWSPPSSPLNDEESKLLNCLICLVFFIIMFTYCHIFLRSIPRRIYRQLQIFQNRFGRLHILHSHHSHPLRCLTDCKRRDLRTDEDKIFKFFYLYRFPLYFIHEKSSRMN